MLGLALLALGASCIPRKRLAYLQASASADSVFNPVRKRYVLQPGDVLSIRYSGPDPAALQPFGAEGAQTQGTSTSSPAQVYLSGYSITDSGQIELPVLGRFNVGNRPVADAEALVQTALDRYVKGARAKVRLASFKVSVLGEVRSPGLYYVYNERLTLLEGLGYAGDLTDAANRRHLRLLRTVQGRITITTLDLTSRTLLASPYFFLQPNDVLYAEPLPSKADRLNLPAISIGVSGVTAIIVLINLLTR